MVNRTPNQAWINLLDMAQWGWTASNYISATQRTITAINGNKVTVDAPLVHAIETQYGGGRVFGFHFNGAIRQVGIERLRLDRVPLHAGRNGLLLRVVGKNPASSGFGLGLGISGMGRSPAHAQRPWRNHRLLESSR